MKKISLALLIVLIVNEAQAGEQKFIDFVLQNAHKRNFTQCDDAIKSAFENVGGEDIRVNSEVFDETKQDSIKLTTTYGFKGDSVFTEVEIRKKEKKCFTTETSVITSEKTCMEYATNMKKFNFVAEIVDFTWMQNDGKIPMILKPFKNGCIIIFQRARNF